MAISALIVAAVFAIVVVYYVFLEKTAGFIIDKARQPRIIWILLRA